VWGQRNAEGEQVMLARCMDILDRHALITGPLLDPAYPWEPEDSLRVAINHLSTEDMLRLWDSLEPPYQLSVPYVVRTARLAARERPIRPSPIRARWSSRPRCRDARRRRHALGWAARHSPDRIAAVGVLAVRIRRHLTDAAPPGLTAIPGLRVRVPATPNAPVA
jgi:hypothetical protein